MRDGQRAALNMLDALFRVTRKREERERSGRVLMRYMRASARWPRPQQQRFAEVIANSLAMGLLEWDFELYDFARRFGGRQSAHMADYLAHHATPVRARLHVVK